MMVLNNLRMQNLLLSRLRVFRLLKELNIPCPPQVCVLREDEAELMGEKVSEFEEEEDYIIVDGVRMDKPFVEKPVDGENHNIYVYYHSSEGGGSRRLFRKVGDQASSFYPDISRVRRDGSYIYEKFVKCMKAQRDIKVYTIGTDYAHAESRVAPTTGEKVKRTGQVLSLSLFLFLSFSFSLFLSFSLFSLSLFLSFSLSLFLSFSLSLFLSFSLSLFLSFSLSLSLSPHQHLFLLPLSA